MSEIITHISECDVEKVKDLYDASKVDAKRVAKAIESWEELIETSAEGEITRLSESQKSVLSVVLSCSPDIFISRVFVTLASSLSRPNCEVIREFAQHCSENNIYVNYARIFSATRYKSTWARSVYGLADLETLYLSALQRADTAQLHALIGFVSIDRMSPGTQRRFMELSKRIFEDADVIASLKTLDDDYED